MNEEDVSFIDRDKLGRTIEIKDINKKWSILYKDEYYYEETFTIFNHNKRLNTIEIIKYIVMKKYQSKMIKQLNYIHNKLLIHQNNDLDIVLCKCPNDAKRLYNLIEKFCMNNKIKNIMFTGSVGELNKTETYKMISRKNRME